MNLYMQFEPLKFYLNQNIESRQSDYCLFESAFGMDFLQMKYPKMAAMLLATKILTFPILKSSFAVNAKFVIKIDIVKPIPPKIEAPSNCLVDITDEIEARFNLLPK